MTSSFCFVFRSHAQTSGPILAYAMPMPLEGGSPRRTGSPRLSGYDSPGRRLSDQWRHPNFSRLPSLCMCVIFLPLNLLVVFFLSLEKAHPVSKKRNLICLTNVSPPRFRNQLHSQIFEAEVARGLLSREPACFHNVFWLIPICHRVPLIRTEPCADARQPRPPHALHQPDPEHADHHPRAGPVGGPSLGRPSIDREEGPLGVPPQPGPRHQRRRPPEGVPLPSSSRDTYPNSS